MATEETQIELIDSGTACELLDVSHRTLMRLTRQRRLPHYKLPGNRIKFDRGELLRWLQRQYQPVGGGSDG